MTSVLMALMLGGPLTIKDVKVGAGPGVRAGDMVTVQYTGKLTNGKQFDTSVGRAPFVFMLGAGQVIKGWDQGVQGMKKGGKRKLTIPAELGYGATGAGADIPPNATLVFDVELLKIERAKVTTLKKGTGRAAAFGDSVELHYKGSLTNGTKFDSSYDRNQPFLVDLAQPRVIPGFTQGILGIKVGEKRRVVIPASLGYGAREVGPIPANSTLVFEIEALRVIPGR